MPKQKKTTTEVVKATGETAVTESLMHIEDRIYVIRGKQVMLDRDLAQMYGVETRTLNQAVKRNEDRFPQDFMFQLTSEEADNLKTFAPDSALKSQNVISINNYNSGNYDEKTLLKSQIVISNKGGDRFIPYAFTESGITMLSCVLRSKTAVQVNIAIMRAFTNMRHFLMNNAPLFQRLEAIEHHQLLISDKVGTLENQMTEVFQHLKDDKITPIQGIFYNNQFFDAHTFVCDLIRSAKKKIILIDNYIDDTVLKRLDKREAGVEATIYTDHISKTLSVDIATHNKEYAPINVIEMKKSHDRFLIIDDDLYHFGASIKDLGKKIFAFDKFIESPDALLSRL